MYGLSYDGFLKCQIKAARTLTEMLDQPTFKDEIANLVKLRKVETGISEPDTVTVVIDKPMQMEDCFIKLTADQLALDTEGKLSSFTDYADRLTRQLVKLIVDTESASSLSDAFHLLCLQT